jgi:hypothetical protein
MSARVKTTSAESVPTELASGEAQAAPITTPSVRRERTKRAKVRGRAGRGNPPQPSEAELTLASTAPFWAAFPR